MVPGPFTNDFLIIGLIGLATIFGLVVVVLLIRMPMYFARGLMWVARGNHEKRIGAVGLAILCIGFLLQAVVNIL